MQNQSIKFKQSLLNFHLTTGQVQTTNVLTKADLLKLKGGSDIIIEDEINI